ncbi:MAG TPA: D-glycero-beta-D-manno-heptose-7-phosphate kinase, partial [Ktedonobacter sp.]|nr:D-glycero-beta-D-manno-heptose-7-phosphate kinase [Ktedonobacter sp.]
LLLACGMDMTSAATLANYAAGVVVGKVGTASVTIEELAAGF